MAGASTTPDLQSILSTLAQYAPPVQNGEPPFEAGRSSTPACLGDIQAQHQTPAPPPQGLLPHSEDARPKLSSGTASPKPIDPATITTWQDGLRCVTKIAAQNAQFATTIRRMMADQRKHEMRWYSERQALKQTQANRASSVAKAHSILQSLRGGQGANLARGNDSSISNDAELEIFDRRTYAAQVEMETTMTAELKGLGVPFFGTDPSLVVPDGDYGSSGIAVEGQPKWSPIVTRRQLMELRMRMVGHLEDLYRD